MPKFKKTLLISLFLLNIVVIAFGQTTLGTGLLSMSFNDKTKFVFYNHPGDKLPTRTIQFFNDKTINGWNIKNFDATQTWLSPEVLWIEYSQLVFRVKARNENWFQVVSDNSNGKTLWIKKSKATTFLTWETYLKGMFGIARLKPIQKIRKSPYETAATIPYHGGDCFQVKSMKGDWIEIFTADYCDESYTDSKTKIKSGWIKWREGNKLLIEYFITS